MLILSYSHRLQFGSIMIELHPSFLRVARQDIADIVWLKEMKPPADSDLFSEHMIIFVKNRAKR